MTTYTLTGNVRLAIDVDIEADSAEEAIAAYKDTVADTVEFSADGATIDIVDNEYIYPAHWIANHDTGREEPVIEFMGIPSRPIDSMDTIHNANNAGTENTETNTGTTP